MCLENNRPLSVNFKKFMVLQDVKGYYKYFNFKRFPIKLTNILVGHPPFRLMPEI